MSLALARTFVAASLLAGASAAHAAEQASAFKLVPLLDVRLRYEHVDQPATDADALTLRARAGIEARSGEFSILAESEGTLALANDYNAFPFPIDDRQRRPQYSVVADPESLELNRLQAQFKRGGTALTLGRQRINLDDQRWVGSVAWRQNEQTFDAIRGETKLGPVVADLTYSISQRTIFGSEAGPRTAIKGDYVFGGLTARTGPVTAKLFTYLLDFDETFALANSSQTYGILVTGAIPLGGTAKLDVKASYARQSDYARNPFDYSADYIALEGAVAIGPVKPMLGWEKLGSDNGRAVQTPMATLHKFNGWADLFLTTPSAGLEDLYGGVAVKFDKVKALPGLNAILTYHRFNSVADGIDYGDEWDASLGFKLGKINLLAKYANYNADGFGVDTEKVWLQAEWAF